jgi:anti-sigma factor RsiW
MTDHDEVQELLPLAAAGSLSAEEQHRVEVHAAGCEACEAELAQWRLITQALEDAPPPPGPELLVERTRNRVLEARALHREKTVSDVILGFLMLFGWTISLAVWFLWKLMSGGGLMDVNLTSLGMWLGGSTLLAWLTAGVAVVALAPRRNAMRRVS